MCAVPAAPAGILRCGGGAWMAGGGALKLLTLSSLGVRPARRQKKENIGSTNSDRERTCIEMGTLPITLG